MDETSEAVQLVRALQSWVITRVDALDKVYTESIELGRLVDENETRWRADNRSERHMLHSLRETLDALIEDWKN